MLVKLKKKSQITIPSVVVKKMNLAVNELFNLETEGNKIILTQVETIPKALNQTPSYAISEKSNSNFPTVGSTDVKKIKSNFKFSV